MHILLDTHAMLWWAAGDDKLSRRARSAITATSSNVYVSAATAWEIATKYRLGKLPQAGPLLERLAEFLADQRFEELSITLRHAQRSGSLPGPHRDPFDRMLIAQAQLENLTLVSNEVIFDRYGVQRLW